MEYYRGRLLANACWLGAQGAAAWDSTTFPLRKWDADWAAKFHEWEYDWTPEVMRLSVDGQLLNEIKPQEAVNADAAASRPFLEPHYLLLNLAIGGTQGGDPAKTEFPARFLVDYVRIYGQSSRDAGAR